MILPIRDEVRGFEPYEAGLSIEEIKEQYKLPHVVKLASNENPLGCSPLALKAIEANAALAFRYPQSGNPKLLEALATKHGKSPASFALGNGSDEVIDLLIRLMASPHIHNIVAFNPCFSIYKTQALLCGVELRQTPLHEDFSFNLSALLKLVDSNTALVFLTNPDNPSGYALKASQIKEFAKELPKTCLLVVDEAYIDFAEPEYSCEPLLDEMENIALLRTFSKCYGLAGLRIGYGIFPKEIADYMRRIRLPFSLNILAEAAALAALNDKEFYKKTVDISIQGRQYLSQALKDLEFEVFPSQTNFLLCKPKAQAKQLFDYLLQNGFILRGLKSYHLPEYLRISIGTASENTALIQKIQEFQHEQS